MKETRPKVLALYRGVLELLDEGADVNSIKVSDITAKAGIGKGTAYDYFKSREEIIACALLYDVEQKIEEEKEELDRHQGFSKKVIYAFDEYAAVSGAEGFCADSAADYGRERTEQHDSGGAAEAQEGRLRPLKGSDGNVPGRKEPGRDPAGYSRFCGLYRIRGKYGGFCHVSGEKRADARA